MGQFESIFSRVTWKNFFYLETGRRSFCTYYKTPIGLLRLNKNHINESFRLVGTYTGCSSFDDPEAEAELLETSK